MKLQYLTAIVLLFSSFSARADEIRTLPLDATLTKKTRSFQIKNLFSFQLPASLPPTVTFRGLTGTVSTTTGPDLDHDGPVWSETLFGLAYTTDAACPVFGQKIDSYPAIVRQFPNQGLAGLIVKQARWGTYTLPVSLHLATGVPIHLHPGGCLFMSFDGTDFADRPYIMTSHLSLLYDTTSQPLPSFQVNGLDSEFLLSPSTGSGSVLNAYVVLPVSQDGPVHPGRVLDVYGDVSATSSSGFAKVPVRSGQWSSRIVVAIYRGGSCQKAFPHHAPSKFMWNDRSGAGQAPNPSSALWKTSGKIMDISLTGKGIDSVMKVANTTAALPGTVKEGDCIVAAILPASNDPAIKGAINVETQFKVLSTP